MLKKVLFLFISLLSFSFSLAIVNINTASETELQTLKGIGTKKAAAIIEYRNKNGLFKSVDELTNVSGIGEKTVQKLRNEITVTNTIPTRNQPQSPVKSAPTPATIDKK